MSWLLIHADDGVIWGQAQDFSLRLSSDVFADADTYPTLAVELRAITLQQARLFGPEGELLVWREGNGFAARVIRDDDKTDHIEEHYLLWHRGRPVERRTEEGFALLQEGQRGQRHSPPLIPTGRERPRLRVRHYIKYDNEGQAYVALSRLVDLVEGEN
jgi:CRISPR-associated protein (TIGR03984 family)